MKGKIISYYGATIPLSSSWSKPSHIEQQWNYVKMWSCYVAVDKSRCSKRAENEINLDLATKVESLVLIAFFKTCEHVRGDNYTKC